MSDVESVRHTSVCRELTKEVSQRDERQTEVFRQVDLSLHRIPFKQSINFGSPCVNFSTAVPGDRSPHIGSTAVSCSNLRIVVNTESLS